MSRRPIARSADLQRLQNEGYDLEVRNNGYLIIKDVPYVTSNRQIESGTFITELDLAGDTTIKPKRHTAYWVGTHPSKADGSKLSEIENNSAPTILCEDLKADFMFSAKADYRDYYHKVTTYIGCITGEAAKLEPGTTARHFRPVAADDDEGPFHYVDTASSRAGIANINRRLANKKIAIIGLGGTGSYVLDLVAKTEVGAIHLIDGDVFSQHNAFRSPGAPSLEELAKGTPKAKHFGHIYSKMHRGIHVHEKFLDEGNTEVLDGLDFVFICIDTGEAKRLIIDRLAELGCSFIDVGLGVLESGDQLRGLVRVTASTAGTHAEAISHITFDDAGGAGNEYASNIQVAELNALNAALAVLRWKKLFGVYADTTSAVETEYSIARGEIVLSGTSEEA